MIGPFLAVVAAALGAVIGSFLNACIHRLPRNLSPGNPKRSFCPSCQRQIPWYENLPILSWLLLRGRCSGCGAKISARYLLVEVLTAALFYFAWIRFGLPLAPVYGVFLALMITATFIDIEHFIIPDVITLGGAAVGVVLSGLVPAMMFTHSRLTALEMSLVGAAVGYGLLWLIVEAGKLAFGKKRFVFAQPEAFVWQREGDTAKLTTGEDMLAWEEIFSREKDELVLECTEAKLEAETFAPASLRFRYNKLKINQREWMLEEIDQITGTALSLTIPREAMGFGDVKLLAAIGAFLGWQAVLFTLCAASIIGCLAALAGVLLARDKSGSRIPFGPFLALGAVLWIFAGPLILHWYFGLLGVRYSGLEF